MAEVIARDDVKPSGRQRAYIARLTCELLGLEFPESRREADALIKRLLAAKNGSVATDDEIPF